MSHLVKLKDLDLGNWGEGEPPQVIYNHFIGSLEPLKNMNKLKILYIYNTDVDSGIEYLPSNLKEFHCSANLIKEAKVKTIEQELRKFGEPNNYDFANLLKA